MKKIKILPSIIMLALCLAVLGIGVYSATTGSNTITGTLKVNSAGLEVELSVYKATTESAGSQIGTTSMYGTQIGATKTSRAGQDIRLSNIEFNSDEANTVYDVDLIDIIVSITNRSAVDIGVYFATSDTAPEYAQLADILYGHQSLAGKDSSQNNYANIVDAEYSFYHHITPSNTDYMHVYLRAKELNTVDLTVQLNMYLNVEAYETHGDEGFTKGTSTSESYGSSTSYLVLPYGTTAISGTVDGGSSLRAISIPRTVTSINSGSLTGCSNLQSVILPDGLTTLAEGAFSASGLTTIVIPNSVTRLNDGALDNSNGLKSVILGSGVATLDLKSYYASLAALEHIHVSEDNDTFDSRNHCNAVIRSADNTLLFGSKNTVIPSTVRTLASYCFAGTGIVSITIPGTVTSIGSLPFGEDHSTLQTVIVGEGITTLPASFLYSCTSVTSVTLPSTLTTISTMAFFATTGLRSLTIPSSVTKIVSGAFENSGITAVAFENTDWWTADTENGARTKITAYDLSTTSVAANCLKDTLKGKYWYNSAS